MYSSNKSLNLSSNTESNYNIAKPKWGYHYRLLSGYKNDQQMQHVLVYPLNSDISHQMYVSVAKCVQCTSTVDKFKV